jgi:DNA repair exonuclease SbcCD ATPase subunit
MDRKDELSRLSQALAEAERQWERLEGKRQELERQYRAVQREWEELQRKRDLYEKVRVLLQTAAEHARLQAKEQMETLVTNALQYVFGPMFRFEIELADHGGKPHAEFYVVTEWEGRKVRTKPQEARGGGVVDITSLALRVAFMESFRPRPEGPLILDEPGKHVSSEYVIPMLEFLKSTGEMFGRQIILVTHDPHLTEGAEQVFQIGLKSGRTVVTSLRLLDNGIN